METVFPERLIKKIESAGIIAVLIIEDEEKAIPLAKTLVNSGITAMELTLRTKTALNSLKRISTKIPEMLSGAGTVLNIEQIFQVKDAGADFAVSPGLNQKVLATASKAEIPFAPGICIPSEIEYAVENKCKILKFFHAEGMGGIKYLKGINSPYKHLGLRYIPLGGLNSNNVKGYLESPEIIAIGGSWIAPKDLIDNGDWDTISRNADAAIKIVREIRG